MLAFEDFVDGLPALFEAFALGDAGERRPGLGVEVGPAFLVFLRADRIAKVAPPGEIPVAVPAMLFNRAENFCGAVDHFFFELRIVEKVAGHFREDVEAVVKRHRGPDAFAFAPFAHPVERIVPVALVREDETVHAQVFAQVAHAAQRMTEHGIFAAVEKGNLLVEESAIAGLLEISRHRGRDPGRAVRVVMGLDRKPAADGMAVLMLVPERLDNFRAGQRRVKGKNTPGILQRVAESARAVATELDA